MQFVLFLYKKLKDKNSFFSFSRTLVSVSVSFCTFLITSIIFVLSGFEHEIKKNIFEFTGNYQFYKYNREPVDILDFSKKISNVKGLKKISPYAKKNVLIQCRDFVEGAVFCGIDIENNKNLKRYVCSGRFCAEEDEIVVGKKLFDKLRIDLSGDVAVFSLEDENRFLKYKIVGVFETGIDEFDDKMGLCDIGGIQKINLWDVNLCDGVNFNFDGDYEELRDRVIDYGGRLRKVENQYVYVMDWLKILGKNSNLYIFIILCTILTNVICILILQLFENKRLIDLLLFIGATSLQVENIFIFRNMKLILRSMVIGAVFAFVLGFLQMKYRFVGLDSSDYYVSFVPIYFDLEMFLLCFFVMLLALLMGLKMTFRFMKKK